ncbi:LytTR family DNA-binding domain-containing protein [Brevundimonas sp. SL130]|uniref:LytTR family DNA-binding domain-containing protein n=1 Tax=Brevundimonas sp. SL130 TaxID=2995143 RepID=UPI00226CC049|nr:LytTR family DNA-binding domain-containing protein [Brevundimonas sp. SL130]WAC59451.1 LytTR family DNA-binding domain-containing protein [Brevundimonas sp. SL130]
MTIGDSRWGVGRAARLGLAVATGLGVLLGLVGPFGSYMNGAAPVRILYWVVSLWAGWALFGLTLPLLAKQAMRRGLSPWLWAPPSVLLLAAPMTLISRALAQMVWGRTFEVGLLEWFGQSLIVSAVATGAILWLMSRPSAAAGTAASAPLSADPRDRLPVHLGREVICLQMEDHYVRVHTPLGSDLVLMSLSQAMAGLAGVEGRQTHRSWWVARAAVVGVVEDGRNLSLRLKGGLTAPVSRARVGPLRAAGWL